MERVLSLLIPTQWHSVLLGQEPRLVQASDSLPKDSLSFPISRGKRILKVQSRALLLAVFTLLNRVLYRGRLGGGNSVHWKAFLIVVFWVSHFCPSSLKCLLDVDVCAVVMIP